MKKIICLAVCLLLTASFSFAQKNQIELVVHQKGTVFCNLSYGLSKNGEEILPARYECLFCEDVKLFVFYDIHNLYIYDINGKKVLHQEFDLPLDKEASVEFEPVRERVDAQCYELRVYFFNSSWGSEAVGTFFYKDGHTYQIERRITRIN